MVHKGYSSYIAYTHTNINSGYGQLAEPDLYFVFSKDEITASSAYYYTVPEGSIMVRVRSGNYSTSQTAVNTERFVSLAYSGNLSIPVYEHIYTNSTFTGTTIQPDILREGSQNNAIQTQTVCTVLCAFLLVFCFFKMWTIHK